MSDLKVAFTLIWWGQGRPEEWDASLLENGYTVAVARGATRAEAEANVRQRYAERLAELDSLVIVD